MGMQKGKLTARKLTLRERFLSWLIYSLQEWEANISDKQWTKHERKFQVYSLQEHERKFGRK